MQTEPPQVSEPGSGKVPDGQKVDKGASDAYFANLTVDNSTNLTQDVSIVVEASSKSKNPFHCGLNPDAAECQDDATASGNATNSSRVRKLTTNTVLQAFDLFCGAFALTNTAAACGAIPAAHRDILFGKATGGSSMDRCVIQLNGAFKVAGSDRCNDVTASSKGVCYENAAAKDNTGARMDFGVHHGCVKAEAETGDTYKFKTQTTMKLPKWKLDSDATLQAQAASFTPAAMQAAAQTEMASADSQKFLKAAVMVAIVAINNDPQASAVLDGTVAGVNLTESLGVTKADAQAMSTAMGSGLSVEALNDDTSVLGGLVSGQVTKLPATFSENLVAKEATAGGSTSAATTVMIGSSVVVGLLSLVF